LPWQASSGKARQVGARIGRSSCGNAGTASGGRERRFFIRRNYESDSSEATACGREDFQHESWAEVDLHQNKVGNKNDQARNRNGRELADVKPRSTANPLLTFLEQKAMKGETMGGQEFFIEVKGRQLGDSFHKAVKQAQYDHGHSGYSGTIAEKSAAILRGTVATWAEAREFAEKDLRDHDNEKFGPAYAVKVTEPGNAGYLFYGVASS